MSMADYMMYTRALENVILWGLLELPLAGLLALCMLTLNRLEAPRRRGLLPMFVVLLWLAAVLFGGAWVLGIRGLAWRTWFQEGMSFALWLVGLVTGIMTIAYARRWLEERGGGRKAVVTGLSMLCLVSVMLMGTLLGWLWCMGPGEQVVTYQGKRMILGKWVWQEKTYDLYEYHGFLVRGAVPVVDWDYSLLDEAAIGVG